MAFSCPWRPGVDTRVYHWLQHSHNFPRELAGGKQGGKLYRTYDEGAWVKALLINQRGARVYVSRLMYYYKSTTICRLRRNLRLNFAKDIFYSRHRADPSFRCFPRKSQQRITHTSMQGGRPTVRVWHTRSHSTTCEQQVGANDRGEPYFHLGRGEERERDCGIALSSSRRKKHVGTRFKQWLREGGGGERGAL